MPGHRAHWPPLPRILLTLLLAAAVVLSWTRTLDHTALGQSDATLTRALAAFAVARGLNGVISVAQGTEIAVQPVGVGVTLTVGEVLDPLNDLVERFSWLALMACVSLGTQMLAAEVVANAWVNGLLSLGAVLGLAALWLPAAAPARAPVLRGVTMLVAVRFLFTLVTLTTGWVDQAVLAERQEAALERIELTRAHLEELEPGAPVEPDAESSMMERFGALLEQGQALDVRARLDALVERVETAIAEIVNLIVVFMVQTILVPVASLLLAWWAFRALWRYAGPHTP